MNMIRAPWRAAALPLALAAAFPVSTLAQPASLRETTVTATRFPEASQSLPFGVSVVTAADIERSGASTVNEALIRVLGLVGRQDLWGGGDYNIDLRGFGTTSDNNQVVVVDGIRLTENDIGGTRLAGIPIESVERIEVLRGSGAVLYGEGATGGVIVITTKSGAGRDRPNGASLYAGAGTHRLRDLRANANVGGGGFSLDVSAQKRDSDGHRENFASDFDATSVTGQWSGDRVRLGARIAQDDLKTGLPGALSPAQYAADPRQTLFPLDRAAIRNERFSVFGEVQLDAWQFALDAGQREKTLRSISFGAPFDYDIDASTVSLRARNEAKIGGVTNLLVLGLDNAHWDRTRLGAFGSLGTQSSRGIYARNDLTLASGTRLSAGARAERLRKSVDNGFTPAVSLGDRLHAWELGASHPVTPQATVYGRFGRSFRLGNVDEFTFTSPGALLRPQTSRDVELGARWKRAAGQVEARLFRSRLQDEIGFDPGAPGPFGPGANVNYDPTQRRGIELDASQQLHPAFTLRGSTTVRKASFRSGPYAGNDVPLVPRRTAALRGEWTPANGHLLTGGVQWVGAQRADFNNACRIPAYSTVDVRYRYDWRNVELSLGASNLLDRRYFTQAFLVAGLGCDAGLGIYPEPGRAVTAAVRVKF
jgi:iron complex outermembrane receptor protein